VYYRDIDAMTQPMRLRRLSGAQVIAIPQRFGFAA
jgi:hypothetical protein